MSHLKIIFFCIALTGCCTPTENNRTDTTINGIHTRLIEDRFTKDDFRLQDFPERALNAELDTQNNYATGEFTIALFADADSVYANNAPFFRFSLFPQAIACSADIKHQVNFIQSVDVYTVNAIGNEFDPGDAVTSLFNVIYSRKTLGQSETTYPLTEWNTLEVNTFDYNTTTFASLAMQIDPTQELEGTHQFTLTATLDDGTIFTIDTAEVNIVQ